MRQKENDYLRGRNIKRHLPLIWDVFECLPDKFKIAQNQMTQLHLDFALQLEKCRLFLNLDEEQLCQLIAEYIAGVKEIEKISYDYTSIWQWLRLFNPFAWISYALTALDYRWQMVVSWNQPSLLACETQFEQGCLSERMQKILIGIPQLLLFGPLKTVLEIGINFRYIHLYWSSHRSEDHKTSTEPQENALPKIHSASNKSNESSTSNLPNELPDLASNESNIREHLKDLMRKNGNEVVDALSEQVLQKIQQEAPACNGPLDLPTPPTQSRRVSCIIRQSRRPSLFSPNEVLIAAQQHGSPNVIVSSSGSSTLNNLSSY